MAHVMVVDDEQDIADLVRLVLELEKHRVTVVTDPEQAVETALQSKPDLVLLDVMMPRMDGFDVYRGLKSKPELKDLAVAFLTSNNRPVDIMVGLHVVKAEDYITKPFGKQELLDRVRVLLKKHGIG